MCSIRDSEVPRNAEKVNMPWSHACLRQAA